MIRWMVVLGGAACIAIGAPTSVSAETNAADPSAHEAAASAHEADASAYQDVERFEDGDVASGGKLYKRYCRGCHGEDGRGGAHTFMPHIENLTKKGYIEHLPDGYLFLVIADGGVAVGKSAYMPAWKSKLDDQDIKDIIAHIRSMPTF